ncbi:MAG: TetR family transcriptional regulator C-terminal domain-containing protein [Lachnospiraceae bacterium]|nr:TetR family transcriptional regulator C-terminal domain-containing protein [Lachnospiraceae bacterium]
MSQINRTTFYKYYGSPEELLNEIETDFLKQLDNEIRPVRTQAEALPQKNRQQGNSTTQNRSAEDEANANSLLPVLHYLYEQRELFCLLVHTLPMQDFASHLSSIPSIRDIFQGVAEESSYSETEEKYIRQFIFQGTFAILYDWLDNENPEPAAKIAEILEKLKEKLL